jgi:hypothetical protein
MTTKELRSNIIEHIDGTDDENLLLMIKSVLENYKQESFSISEDRIKILDKAKLQILNNEFVSDEDINKDDEGWLIE